MGHKMRTVVVGFNQYPELIEAMYNSNDIDVVAHFTHEQTSKSICINDLYFGNQCNSLAYEMPVELYDAFLQKYFLRAMANFARIDSYTGKHTGYSSSIYLFRKLTTYLYDLILRLDVDLIIISHMPHECIDMLIESLGNFLDIPVRLLVTPSYTDKTFFCLNHHSEYGLFQNKEIVHKSGPVPIETLTIDSSTSSRSNAWCQRVAKNSKSKTDNILSASPYTGFYNIEPYKQRVRDMQSMPRQENITGKYVYFPLHVQPEASTMALAPCVYDDQILCIEQIAKIIPQEYAILVKEHPSQTFYYRDKEFYARLRALPQVRLVRDDMDSHTLIRQSSLVATVTGTAGWEALKYGHPVIYFGYATYREMPGAFRFSPDMDIQAVLQYRVNREDVEASLQHMFSTMYEGGLGEMIPSDRKKNSECFLKALGDIMGKVRAEISATPPKLSLQNLRNRSRSPQNLPPEWLVPTNPLHETSVVYPKWKRCYFKGLYILEKILLKLHTQILRI